jgi:FtsZ-binding cell division protein ZapB|tara:strand:+ start:737 stop:1024 length:288 start_codon:yes stop_codon:yes gene_type:complete
MAKNTTKKIKQLKKDKPSKITNEELNQVQSIINNINRAQLEIGNIETRKHSLLHHVSVSQEQLANMQTEFEKIYGTADINIQDGTINHNNNEQTN